MLDIPHSDTLIIYRILHWDLARDNFFNKMDLQ